MDDVKRVMQRVESFFLVVMGVGLLLVGYLYRRKEVGRGLWYGGITTVAGMVVVLLWVVISFDSLFTFFHLLLFPQGNWQFSSDSLLIQTFPIDFFISMAMKIFGLNFVFAGVILGGGYALKSKRRLGADTQ